MEQQTALQSELKSKVVALESRVSAACTRAARARDSVTLVAVSKKQPPELIRLAWELGQCDFGENYAQELREKHAVLSACTELRWHAIGPVQPKNAKYIARAAHTFHALDCIKVAMELSKRRVTYPLRCFIQVNIADENTKAGIAAPQAEAFFMQLRKLPHIDVAGLSVMPPLTMNPRPYFERTALLAQTLGLPQLSMGTSKDFEVAIECGATFVRIGTDFFGQRPTIHSNAALTQNPHA